MGDQIEAMRQTLKTGVAVVSSPQLFPTPATLAARMVELADIQPGQDVLEPSAGTDVLCKAITALEPRAKVFAVEVNHQLCELLSDHKPAGKCRRGHLQERLAGRLSWSASDWGALTES